MKANGRLWFVDFEFGSQDGENPDPACVVARCGRTDELVRAWLRPRPSRPPFAFGPRDTMISYYASAEIGCMLELGWPLPGRFVDLYAEFRVLTNGLSPVSGNGLLGAALHFGLPAIGAPEKDGMRELACRLGSHSEDERRALLDYCQSDVDLLVRLYERMKPHIDRPRALLRGRFMAAAAQIERRGVPIDAAVGRRINSGWPGLRSRLIEEVDREFGAFEDGRFGERRWMDYCARSGLQWPLRADGRPDLRDKTFDEMAKIRPAIQPMRQLRGTLSRAASARLTVGRDGRCRCLLSAFRSKTGRNQPSSVCFPFGPHVWVRFLIRPEPGRALAYIDYRQQEFGIGAALSRDEAMMEAYRTGDPYLRLAELARGARGKSGDVAVDRSLYKRAALAVQYGMGAESLGASLGDGVPLGRELIERHRRAFPGYWRWSEAVQDVAMLHGRLVAPFGWQLFTSDRMSPASLRNFPLQAAGAEMLRVACIAACERGIGVCAPVHDALLVEADAEEIEGVVAATRRIMAEAAEVTLGGFRLNTEARIARWPERLGDERGRLMWETICRLLGIGIEGDGLER